MTVPIDLILEGMLAILLAVTAAYCVLLDRKLRQLRSGQDGLRDIIKGLNTATGQAQGAIAQLKAAGEAHARDLKGQIGAAKALRDELSLMIESGNSLADRLEGRRSGPREVALAEPDGRVQPLWAEEEVKPAFEDRLRRALRDAR